MLLIGLRLLLDRIARLRDDTASDANIFKHVISMTGAETRHVAGVSDGHWDEGQRSRSRDEAGVSRTETAAPRTVNRE